MHRLLVFLVLATVPASAHAAAPFFSGVGHLPSGFTSIAGDVSNTGVAYGVGAAQQAFLWSQAGGLEHYPAGRVFGISADGSVLLVSGAGGFSLDVDGTPEPITGLYGIRALSGDGTTVVGLRDRPDLGTLEAARWTAAGGVEGLGFLPHQNEQSVANDVSYDGTAIAGESNNNVLAPGFRWTAATGMAPMDPISAVAYGKARVLAAISGSGEKIVGFADGQGYVWSEADGYVGLGNTWDPGIPKIPRDVNHAGSRIVGGNAAATSSAAFLWDPVNGMRELRAVLEDDYGLDLTDWTLLDAHGISPNGRWIAGEGINPAGYREGWVAFLGSPACGLGVELPLALALLASWRRRMVRIR